MEQNDLADTHETSSNKKRKKKGKETQQDDGDESCKHKHKEKEKQHKQKVQEDDESSKRDQKEKTKEKKRKKVKKSQKKEEKQHDGISAYQAQQEASASSTAAVIEPDAKISTDTPLATEEAPRSSRFVYSYRVPEKFSFGKTHLTKSFDRSLTMFRATVDLFNVAYKATTADIEQLFESFGPVQVRLVLDEFSGQPTGRAEVQIDRSRAAEAIQKLNRADFLGRVLSVSLRAD